MELWLDPSVPGIWGGISAEGKPAWERLGWSEVRGQGATVGFSVALLVHHSTSPEAGNQPAFLGACSAPSIVYWLPRGPVKDGFCLQPAKEKGQLRCERFCQSPPLAEQKWGQLCLGFAENSREDTRELKTLAP